MAAVRAEVAEMRGVNTDQDVSARETLQGGGAKQKNWNILIQSDRADKTLKNILM